MRGGAPWAAAHAGAATGGRFACFARRLFRPKRDKAQAMAGSPMRR